MNGVRGQQGDEQQDQLFEITTHWSMVRCLDRSADTQWRRSWDYLVRCYRRPLINLVRRELPLIVGRSVPEAEAEDVIQAFLIEAMEKQWLGRADPALGRFRSFLRTIVKRYLHSYAVYWRRKRRAPAGVKIMSLSMDDDPSLPMPAQDADAADNAFDRDWAEALVSAAMERLANRSTAQEAIIRNELHGRPLDDGVLAEQLGVKAVSMRVLRHRARRAFRAAVRAEVAATIAEPDQLQDEMYQVQQLLASGRGS